MHVSRRRTTTPPRHLATRAARLGLTGVVLVLLLAAASAVAGASATAAAPSAVGLAADGTTNPLGIDDAAPVLRWQISSAQRAVTQTKYRVLVASSAAKLNPDDADIWDTGDVHSAALSVTYAGPTLQPRTRYYWAVRISSRAGVPAV